jgi:hypothetical protein
LLIKAKRQKKGNGNRREASRKTAGSKTGKKKKSENVQNRTLSVELAEM